jgi:integrase
VSRRAKLPPGVYRRGEKFLAIIRLKGFDPAMKMHLTADEAIAWAAATRKELTTQRTRGVARRDVARLTVGELIREYLADPKVKGLRSFETYHDRLDWWIPAYGATKVLDFGVLAIREARAKLASRDTRLGDKKLAPATVNRYLAAMRRVWSWGRNAGLVPTDRAWPTDLMLSEPRGRTRYLSDVELKALLEAARKRGVTEYAMLIVSLATGVRQGELLRLTWADVDFERGTARILLTKNDESRPVHLSAAAISALKAVKKLPVVGARCFIDPHGEPYTKDTLAYWWNVVRNEVGITNFRWHDLRHTCASILAQNRSTLLEIGSVLGHKSPSVTMRYAHLVAGAPVTGHAALDEKLRGA